MDFDWPMKSVWKGYINPYHGSDCPWCYDKEQGRSDGLTEKAREYQRKFYGYMNDWPYIGHPYKPMQRYCPMALPYKMERWEYDFIISDKNPCRDEIFPDGIPTYENVREYFLKNGTLGFDRVQWLLVEEYCRLNNVPSLCPHCDGDGVVWINDEIKQLHDNFERVEPPVGDGYQLWETTSEGSPVSPVFATFDELCEWCEKNAHTFASYTATKEEWKKMLDDGFVYHQEGNVMFM